MKHTPSLSEHDRDNILVEFDRLVTGHPVTVDRLLQWAGWAADMEGLGIRPTDAQRMIDEHMKANGNQTPSSM